MADVYESMRDLYDAGQSEGPVSRFGNVLLSPDIPGERVEMGLVDDPKGGVSLFHFRARWLLVPCIIWLLGYISALFPYIGAYAYNRGNGEITYSLFTPSPRIMPLFKGQVAFIDYKLDSNADSGSSVHLDIKPWPGLGQSQNRLVVKGKAEGRFAVPITETDFYQFSFSSSSAVKDPEIYYSVTWGAR
jgi:hypothetical protein